MIIKTLVPKVGETFQYIGKPVTNELGVRIGSISEVVDAGDHYDIIMEIEGVHTMVFNNAVMGEMK